MSIEKLFPPDWPAQDNMPLWRYMKLSTFFMLLEGKAFFPSVATLQRGDPLEGDLIPGPPWLMTWLRKACGGNSEAIDEWLEQKADHWERKLLERNPEQGHVLSDILSTVYIRQLAKRRAVWCWFCAPHESAGMWSIYGAGGIAIGTRLSRLISALPQDRRFQIAPITYANRDQPSHPSYFNPGAVRNQELVHRPHLIKGLEYQHENEVRVTTTCWPDEPGRLIDGIKPHELIYEVVISPLLAYEESKAVQAQIERFPWTVPKPIIRDSSILGHIRKQEEGRAQILEMLGPAIPLEEPGLPPPLDSL